VIRFRTFAIALALSTAAAACSHPPPTVVVHAGAPDHERVLTATGTATIGVSPDCADLTLTVTAEAARPGDAFARVRDRQTAVLDALKQLGVDPVYRWVDDKSRLEGFEARITITATTRRFDQIGPLMEAAAEAGVTSMSSRFRRSDLETLRKQVRDQALAAAQIKAADTAAALGITLGAISGVAEAGQSYLFSNEYFPSAGAGGGEIGGDLQPLTIEVTLKYDLS
jgi:uncharacterized protein YggE